MFYFFFFVKSSYAHVNMKNYSIFILFFYIISFIRVIEFDKFQMQMNFLQKKIMQMN